MKNKILSLLILSVLVVMIGVGSAVHTSDVTVTTDGWLQPNTLTDFTIFVTNNGADSIKRVIIETPLEYSNLECGNAPTDWELYIDNGATCAYRTTTNLITIRNSKEFTLQVTTSSDIEDAWLVTSVDTASNTDDNFVVPEGWTIQDAIDAADEDDTIVVPAGEYEENPLVNVNGITLHAETGVVLKGYFAITVDNVILEGFELDGSSLIGSFRGFEFNYNIKGVKIRNNIIHDFTSGIYINPTDASTNNIIIENNEIYNTIAGIGGDSYKGVIIQNNNIHNNDEGVGYSHGEIVGYNNGPEIHGNRFEDNTKAVIKYSTWPAIDNTEPAINATNNWWGTYIESEIQALVSGNVDFDPWWYDENGVITEPQDWIIQLYADSPNLISIPLVPESTYYQDVLAKIKCNIDRVWAYTYNETKKKNEWSYKTVSSSCRWSAGSLQEIRPGYGYIVFMKNDDVLYGKGKMVNIGGSGTQPVTPPETHLANGYNLIGVYGTTPGLVNVKLASLKSGEIEYWSNVYDADGNEVTNLEPGKGYWIAMSHLPSTVTEDYYTYYPRN